MKRKNTDEIILMMLLMTAAVGICTGVFSETFISGDGKKQLASLLSNFLSSPEENITFAGYAAKSAVNSAVPLIFFFFIPISVFFVPVVPLFIFIKSLSAGFASAMLFEAMGKSAFKAIIISLAVPSIIKILTYSFVGAISANMAISGSFKNKNALHANARRYMHLYAAAIILLVLISVAEAFIIV